MVILKNALEQCANKTNQKFGEWYEVDQLGKYFTSCFSESRALEHRVNENDMALCFKKLKL